MKWTLSPVASERLFLIAISTILLLFGAEEYGYTHYLRHKYRQSLPPGAAMPFDGPTNLVVPWMLGGDEELYAAKVNQIRLHGVPLNPWIKEDRHWRTWLFDLIPLYLIAFLTWPVHQIQNAWMIAGYGWIPLWFALLYMMFRTVYPQARSPSFYALAALFPLLMLDTLSQVGTSWGIPNPGKWSYLILDVGFGKRPLAFIRMSSPLITYSLVSAWFFSLLIYLTSRVNRNAVVGSVIGAGLGLLAFVHPYEWTLAAVAAGFILIFFLVQPCPDVLPDVRRKMSIVVAVGACSSAAAAWLLSARSDASVMARSGLLHTHAFETMGIYPLIAGIWAWRTARGRTAPRPRAFWTIIGGAALAGAALLNQQIVTGASILRQHYSPLTNYFVGLLLAAAAAEWLLRRPAWMAHARTAVAALLCLTFFNVKSACEKRFKASALPAAWEDGLVWVDRNVPMDGKVLTLSMMISRLLPVYTRAKLQTTEGAPMCSREATDVNLARFAVLLRTLDVDTDVFLKERWLHTGPEEQTQLYQEGSIPPTDMNLEKIWAYAMLHQAVTDPVRLKDGESKVRQWVPLSRGLSEDYYVWLNDGDIRFLAHAPETRRDWRLAYQNNGVRIYHHTGG